MVRKSTFFMLLVCLGVGFALFILKYQVMALSQHHEIVKKNIRENQEALHILRAEWAHLNDPKRLKDLSFKYLKGLGSPKSGQIIALDDFAPKLSASHNQSDLDYLIAEALDENKKLDQD